MSAGKIMHLGLFAYPAGHHVAAWRHPQARADAGISFDYYRNLAALAEGAGFDFLFLADGAGQRSDDAGVLSRTAHSYVAQFEPITLLSALAVTTRHLGLMATVSSSFNEPFHIARKFASIDHLSGGRAGLNLVTSANDWEARNFGLEAHYAHATRYARAAEFADVLNGLWDSWEADAFVYDKAEGRFFDPARRHVLHHKGPHFQVRGPLNVPRSPQGRPVIVQAGASTAGRALAARTAEVVFTAQQSTDEAVAFAQDLKAQAEGYNRDPRHVKVMPGLFPVVGRSRAEAQDKFDQLQDLVHPEIGLDLLAGVWVNIDLSRYDPDGPLPDLPPGNGSQSRQKLLFDLARREGLSIRQLYLRVVGARGHLQLIGTGSDIADAMQDRFEAGGADGFIIMPPLFPAHLQDFITFVLPELRRRGLRPARYAGATLRDHLGLPAETRAPLDSLVS